MTKKLIKKPELIRHPFAKEKLVVEDSFVPSNHEIKCPCCDAQTIESIKVLAPDTMTNKKSYVITCSSCKKQSWFLLNE
jgi:hypothetical protein